LGRVEGLFEIVSDEAGLADGAEGAGGEFFCLDGVLHLQIGKRIGGGDEGECSVEEFFERDDATRAEAGLGDGFGAGGGSDEEIGDGLDEGLLEPGKKIEEGRLGGVRVWGRRDEGFQVEICPQDAVEEGAVRGGKVGEIWGGVHGDKIGLCLDERKGLNGFCLVKYAS
jgi:hypothetical protein